MVQTKINLNGKSHSQLVEIILELQKKVQRMDVAISEMERMSEVLEEELTFEKEINFEDLGWKQVLVSELSIYKKYLSILKG